MKAEDKTMLDLLQDYEIFKTHQHFYSIPEREVIREDILKGMADVNSRNNRKDYGI